MRRLVVGGALSGCVWFGVAMTFDKGVQDYNYPVIPTNSVAATVGSLLGAILTGVSVALLFRRAWTSRSRILHCLNPFPVLAAGIGIFSLLTWTVWLLLGEPSSQSATHRLSETLSFFVFYGLLSLFTPFLYVLAFLNQEIMRRLAPQASPPAVEPA